MKKLLLFLTVLLGSVGLSYGETYVTTLTTSNQSTLLNPAPTSTTTVPTTWTENSVSWNLSYEWGTANKNYIAVDGDGLHVGSKSANIKSLEMSTNQIAGNIKEISVTCKSNGTSPSLAVSVGGVSFLNSANSATQSITSTSTKYTFKGESSGLISIKLAQTATGSSGKNLYIKSVEVIYENSTPDPDAPAKPEIAVSEGMEVSMTCEEGAQIFYTIDGTDPAESESAVEYATPFTPEGDCTVIAKAVKDGVWSVEAREVVVFPIATLAEFMAAAPTSATKLGCALTVVYDAKINNTVRFTVVTDGVSFAILKDAGTGFEVGDIIPAGITGVVSAHSGMPVVSLVDNIGTVTKGGTFETPEIKATQVSLDNVNLFGVMSRASISGQSSKNATITDAEGNPAKGYNEFLLGNEFANSAKVNIVGIVGRYNTNAQFWPISITEVQTLGELQAVVSDGQTIQNDELSIVEGTKITFSAENADKIEIVDDSDAVVATSEDTAAPSTLEWIPAVTAEEGALFTVKAYKEGEEAKELMFMLTVTAKGEVKLGEIVAVYGEENTPVEKTLEGIIEGTVFTFSAANAESIVVKDSKNSVVAEGVDSAEWIATITEGEELTVTATLAGETKTFSFMVEVIADPAKELGDIVVTTSDGQTINAYDEITVLTGTVFTFSAANATNITVQTWLEERIVVNENASTATWTVENAFAQDGITVTATDGKVGKPKTFEFLLTVNEPERPETKEYVKVASMDDFVAGAKYILVGSTAKAVKVGIMGKGLESDKEADKNKYRTAHDVTVAGTTELQASYSVSEDMDVCPFTIVSHEDGYALQLENGNYIAVKSYNENSAVDLQEAELGTKGTSGKDLTKFSVSIADDGEATIKNGNLLSFNASADPWRFKSYKAKQSPVYLYKLVEPQPELPTYTQPEGEKHVVISTTLGELHAIIAEYDADDNLVWENNEEIPAGAAARIPAADDKTWTRKVAEANEEYVVNAPVTEGNYLVVRTKSVLDGKHSDEVTFGLNSQGTVSGIADVIVDNGSQEAVYYNLQGVRVNPEAPGIYIRRQDTKVEKIVIR